MPYRDLIRLSYFVQGSHCLLGSLHVWCVTVESAVVINTIMALVNGVCFVRAASWRASLRAHMKRRQHLYNLFRR